MSLRPVTCPNCSKVFQVPAAAAGKRIKCKACEHVFAVPVDPPTDKPTVVKPTVAKPAVAKPASPPPPPPPPAADATAPIPFKDDDDDDDTAGGKPKLYGVTKDADEDIPRCPFCAVELDPPDAKVCVNCGYDLIVRKRHRTVKTYALTGGDIFKWWLPAILWGGLLLFCGGVLVWSLVSLEKIARGENDDGPLLSEKANPLTGKKDFFVEPMACNVCCLLMFISLAGWAVPVIYKRIKQPKPIEEEKKK